MATVTVSSSGHVTTTGLSSFATIGSTGTAKRNWNGSIVVTFTAQPIVTLGSSVSPLVPVVSSASFAIPQNPSLDSLIGHLSVSNTPLSAMNIASGDPNHLFAVYPTNQNLKTSPTITPVPNAVYNLGVTATNAGGTSPPASVQVAVGILPGPFTTQNGDFTIGWDAVPTLAAEDVVVGLCFANPAAFSDVACATRFSTSGNIEVRNGGAYASDVTLPYTASTSYHFRLVVRLSNHTYDVFVTPQGQSEVQLANNYAFRTEQANVASLSYLGRIDSTGDATLSNLVGPSPITPTAPVVTSRSFNLSIPASAGTVVGTMTATGSPTSWAITAGNSAGNFAISNAGVITVTAAGATGITAGTSSLTCTATNAVGSGSGTATVTAAASGANDGLANAPAGAAQFPTLLSGYAHRPPWNVAGVDYRVGWATGQVFKVPGVDALPSGASVSGSTVSVTGSNVTLDGWDLLTSKYTLQVTGSNLTVKNCKLYHYFNPAGNNVSNMYIGYTEISNGGDDVQSWVDFFGSFTNLQIEYCYMHAGGNDGLGIQSSGEITFCRYCLFSSPGMITGTHGDMTQVQGTFTGVGYNFNFCTLLYTQSNTTQGLMCEPNSGNSISGGTVGNCTMIGSNGQPNAMVGVTVAMLTSTFTVHDNYYDLTNGQNFAFNNSVRGGANDGSTRTVFRDNVNMNTGIKESLANDTPPGTP